MRERNFLFAVLMIIIFGLIMLFLYNKSISYEEKSSLERYMDNNLLILNNKIEETTKMALATSTLLSKSSKITECLQNSDKEACLGYLLDVSSSLLDYKVFNDVRFHMHTRDQKSFSRTWEQINSTSDSLSSFRHSLNRVKTTSLPTKGIEIGRYGMLMRAIAPIFSNNEYIGTIETIIGFDEITNYFKSNNIELYVLMNNKYLNTVTKIKYPSSSTIGDYTIINKENPGTFFLKNIDFVGTNYTQYEDYYILYTPIYDIDGSSIGYFVMSWVKNLSYVKI